MISFGLLEFYQVYLFLYAIEGPSQWLEVNLNSWIVLSGRHQIKCMYDKYNTYPWSVPKNGLA